MKARILSSTRLGSLLEGLQFESLVGNCIPHFTDNDVLMFSIPASAFEGVLTDIGAGAGIALDDHGSQRLVWVMNPSSFPLSLIFRVSAL